MRALLAHRLYAKLSKCAFNCIEVFFFDFIIGRRDIQMKQSRIDVINKWSVSEFAKDILIFFGFASFYRRFIKRFSQIVALLTDLIADAKKGEVKSIFVWSAEAQKAFFNLKIAFINAFILQHYNWSAALQMKIDAFNRGVGGVFNQRNNDD